MPKKPFFIGSVTRDSVIVFVGSHPDDETVIGSLLAWTADHSRQVWVVSLTRGEAGWNLEKGFPDKKLTDVRLAEFASTMALLKVNPVMFDFINGVSKSHPEGLAVLEPESVAIKRWNTKGDRGQTPDGV